MHGNKREASPLTDFFCGFSIVGWIILLFRMKDNHISWEAFVGGIVTIIVLRLALQAC